MNNTYRLVWKAFLGLWQAAPETARGRGKSKAGRALRPLLASAALALSCSALAAPLLAVPVLPTGGSVVAGDGTITQSGNTTTIEQATLEATLAAADRASARSAGRFRKVNLDLARIQALSERVDLYGRLSRQWASNNLDSSEKFGLGGAHGVRAYPSGEGFGDAGSIAQVELRYTMENFAPFVFHDAGKVTINHTPWCAGTNKRSLSGSGIGLRFHRGHWYANLVAAWRGRGGAVQSDIHASSPLVLADLQYRF